MSVIVTIGIDLAKNVYTVHGFDTTGEPVLVRPNVLRTKLLGLIPAVAFGSISTIRYAPLPPRVTHRTSLSPSRLP